MTKLFYEGGALFMGTLTLIFFVLILVTLFTVVLIAKSKGEEENKIKNLLSYIKNIGLFGLVFGIFGQLIGLYEAFGAIQEMGDVSPALLAGGLKVSMLTTLYGVVIFLFANLFWFGLKLFRSGKTENKN
jgi:biopolymer transport protein ExbB/TolQ